MSSAHHTHVNHLQVFASTVATHATENQLFNTPIIWTFATRVSLCVSGDSYFLCNNLRFSLLFHYLIPPKKQPWPVIREVKRIDCADIKRKYTKPQTRFSQSQFPITTLPWKPPSLPLGYLLQQFHKPTWQHLTPDLFPLNRAAHNPRNSSEARAHAQEEVTKLSHAEHEHERQSGQPQYSSDEEHPYNERHEENVKRGLKAYVLSLLAPCLSLSLSVSRVPTT